MTVLGIFTWLVIVLSVAAAACGDDDERDHGEDVGQRKPDAGALSHAGDTDALTQSSAGNVCPGSFLGCDVVAPAHALGDCRFESESDFRPDAVRLSIGAEPCLTPLNEQDCELDSGWTRISDDQDRSSRKRFQLCGDACELVRDQPDARVEAVALCRE